MLGINAIADLIVVWVTEVCPDIGDSHTAYASGRKDKPLPDVAVEIQEAPTQPTASDFPELDIQQAILRSYHFNVLLVVKPEPEEEASRTLADFVDALTLSALSDPTLGNRVPGVSPTIRSTFTPPFVEFDDRTRGRLATIELQVGELIDPEE